MSITLRCEEIQQLLKLTKGDISIVANDGIYLIAKTDSKTKNTVMIKSTEDSHEVVNISINRMCLENISSTGELIITDTSIQCGSRTINYTNGIKTLKPIKLNEILLTIPNVEFDKGIDVEYSLSKDEARPILKGICLDQDNFIALDGFRLAIRKHSIQSELDKYQVMLPKELISCYKKIKSKEDVNIYIDDKFVTLEVGNIQISVDVMQGEYIKYRTLLPQEHKLEVRVDSKEILNLLKSYKNITLIHFDIKNDHMVIKARNEFMGIEDKVSAQINGEAFEIAFNPEYLIDSLKHYEGEVTFELNSSISPMIITDGNCKSDLVLPVRLMR